MNSEKQSKVDVGKTDPQPTRTKDNPLGIDDIGLPAGIQKDEISRLEEIKPDPEKARKEER